MKKILHLPSPDRLESQGLLSLGGITAYCWASVVCPGSTAQLFFLPWPWLTALIALLFTGSLVYCCLAERGLRHLQFMLRWFGGAFGGYLAAGMWAKGYDLSMVYLYWLYLMSTATALKKPTDALMVAIFSFSAMSMAHFWGDYTKMPCPWWVFTAIGLPLLLQTYEVLLRGYAARSELRLSHKLLKEKYTEIIENQQKLEENGQKLRIYAQQLEDSNQHLQEFAYVISHDLREPLRTITAYTQLLKRYLKPEVMTNEMQDFMHFIVDAAKRMDGQINGILEYSRVGRADMAPEYCSLRAKIETVRSVLYAQITESGATLEIADAENTELWADKMQLLQLFQNLVGNALKYRKPDVPPHIRINAKRLETTWEIRVADNGIGIETPYLETIFGVFRRLHTRADVEGSGIGLSICRRIVQRHGGKIWVESNFGEGATFVFTLPFEG